MDQRDSDQLAGFFLPVPPSYQLPDTRASAAPIGMTEILELHSVSLENESSTRQTIGTVDTLDESNNIPEFFPVSPAHRGFCSGAIPIPARQDETDGIPEFFPVSPAHRGFCSGAIPIPARQDETDGIPEFFPVSRAHRGFHSGAGVVPEKPDADNIPEFFPISPVHRSFCSGASPIPAQPDETDNVPEFFPVSPLQRSQSNPIRAVPLSGQQDGAGDIPEFLPVSPESRGSLSGASTVPDELNEANNIPKFLPVALQHEGFHSGALRAPVGLSERSARYAGRRKLLGCMHNSAGECSWENHISKVQPQLREMYTKFHAIRQARDLDFCFTGIPFRYRPHVGPRCRTLINAMLIVQCVRNWILIKHQTGIVFGTRGKTQERLQSRDCAAHGTTVHTMGAIAAITGREKWTYYVNKNVLANKVPRDLRPSSSHSCDYGLLCNDMYCLDMEPLGRNSMRGYHCFRVALATYDSGKPIPKFCSFPEHSEHPCNLWRAIEHNRHSMSMIIKEFAFFSQTSPEQLTSSEIGPFFQLTHNGVPFPHLGIDDLDFSYITWDHAKANVPQRPRVRSIQPPVSTDRPEELALFVQSKGRSNGQAWNGLNQFIDSS